MRRRRLLVVAFALLGLVYATAAVPERSQGDDVSTLYAPHGTIGEFFNPWRPHIPGPWWKVAKTFLVNENPYDKSKPPVVPIVKNDGSSLAGREKGAAITWVGHATVAIHDEDDVILTDPIWSERALIPRRHSPPGVPLSAIPDDALAVVSHNHYDHLDARTVAKLPASVSWFVPLGMADWFHRRGRRSVVELDWWQSAKHGRWTITCLPAQHWSRRLWQPANSTLWCSWLLDSGSRRYFFVGDSGYFHGFRELGKRFAPIDVALLPIGAYEPRDFMEYQHMGPDEAWQAFRDLGARWFVPIHWGTFDLSYEPVDWPPKELARVAEAAGGMSEVEILAIGERWEVPPRDRAGAGVSPRNDENRGTVGARFGRSPEALPR